MRPAARVYLARMESPVTSRQVLMALEWIHWADVIAPGARVFVKPNLTWPVPTPGVTTTPAFIEAVVAALRTRTDQIIIGESNGGYHSYEAEEALAGHGVYQVAERYGVQALNLSKQPAENVTAKIGGQTVQVELPTLLLHDIDVFITLPVPKVHAMTRVSLAFKNQWGCQPNTMRMRSHALFDLKIVAINRLVKARLALYDGTYFLDRNGPMHGEVVRMDVLLAANDIGAGDAICCQVMQMDARKVRHYRLAMREGMFPRSTDTVALNQPIASVQGRRFRLDRSLVNLVALAAFNSGWFTYALYESAFGDLLHRAFYAVRKNKIVGRLLHGSLGPPAVSGSSKPPAHHKP